MTRSAVNYLLFNSNKKVTKSPSSTPHSTSPTSAVLFHPPPRNPLQLLRPPPHSKNTNSLPPNLIYNLLVASTSLLKPSFTTILSEFVDAGTPPLCVVADFFFGWSAAVSYEFGIFHVIFSGFGLGCYYSSWINLPHKNCEFILPDFQEADCEVWSQNTASKLKMAVSKVSLKLPNPHDTRLMNVKLKDASDLDATMDAAIPSVCFGRFFSNYFGGSHMSR